MILYLLFSQVILAAETSAPQKISLRAANGSFSYSELGTSSTSFFNPDLSWHYFLHPKHSIGLGLDLYFSITAQSVSLFGVRAIYRYYFKGEGQLKQSYSPFVSRASTTRFAYYAGTELKRYSYFLGSNPSKSSGFEQSGTFYNINLDGGVDYRLSKDFELNGELNYSMFSMAGTDNRVVMSAIVIFAGVSYLW